LIDELDRIVEDFVLRWKRAECLHGLQRFVDERELAKVSFSSCVCASGLYGADPVVDGGVVTKRSVGRTVS
jgi:hypothetical protein